MWVSIKTNELKFRLSVPVPIRMAGFLIKQLPPSVFYKMTEDVSAPYDKLITKETVCIILDACIDILKENKGLEIIHVNASDGTFVSIRL